MKKLYSIFVNNGEMIIERQAVFNEPKEAAIFAVSQLYTYIHNCIESNDIQNGYKEVS